MEPTTQIALLGALAAGALLALFTVLSRKGRSEDEARAYLAGFKYVLSDDPDAAIAELSRAAELNRQTLETYFALGTLFRRKGELDRAIRLHQNILLRPGLTPDVKRNAQLALALDYRRAGLKDKAAEVLEAVLAQDPDHREALIQKRQLVEERGEWAAAIEVQTKLVRLDGRGEDVLAHLLAASARSALPHHPADAEELAERAVRIHPGSADALLALAEARSALGRSADAAAPARRAVELEPELVHGAVPLLEASAAPDEVASFLEQQAQGKGSQGAALELALALLLGRSGRVEAAIGRLRRLVEREPRFWEARKALGTLLLQQDRTEELRADYQQILGTLGQPVMGFLCAGCRQKLPEHLFRCPACGQWGRVRRET